MKNKFISETGKIGSGEWEKERQREREKERCSKADSLCLSVPLSLCLSFSLSPLPTPHFHFNGGRWLGLAYSLDLFSRAFERLMIVSRSVWARSAWSVLNTLLLW